MTARPRQHVEPRGLPRQEAAAVHFVRFEKFGQHYWNAARVFGEPDFMHIVWDRRARREIADGDIIVFAKGECGQPVSEFNGSDEAYQ